MSFIVGKKNGTLLYKDLDGYETRNISTFWCIKKADEKYNWKDFPLIKIYTQDSEESDKYYTYSKQNSFNNLVPDFNFHAWPQVGIDDYEEYVNQIDTAGLNNYKIHKVGWIGSAKTNTIRQQLLQIANNKKDLFEVFDMNWIKTNKMGLNATKYISMAELVKKYSILIDIEGYGYSGRIKHLLWSHRPLIIVNRPHKEFFFEFLQEWVHYIPVKRDLSDLVEKTEWCINNYDKAVKIAENAYKFSKVYLTRDACYKQWNKIITKNYIV